MEDDNDGIVEVPTPPTTAPSDGNPQDLEDSYTLATTATPYKKPSLFKQWFCWCF
ncbi:hypothetical protein OROMI_024725 [Orobanche minor]